MAKIERNTQKIFGGNAPSDDIAALGSFKTGTPLYTDSVQALQNEAFEQGYGASLVADEAPFLEEQNSVPYVLSKQLAYNFQEGIPEYDANTTYYIGSIVKTLNEENKPILYYSIIDDNVGNEVTNAEAWKELTFTQDIPTGLGGLNLFDLIKSDHILEGDEAVGKALLGTYVYKTAVSGTRNGYPDFYNRCVAEKNAGEDFIIKSDAITLPTFTSNTTNGITISDSRGNTTTLQTLINNGNTNTAASIKIGLWSTYWVNIDYGQPTYLKNYKICSDNVTNPEHPTDWTIQGSNDGINFDILGTYTNQSWPSINYYRTFNEGAGYTQTKPYKQYRLVFSAGLESSNNGELGYITFNAERAIAGKKNTNGHIFYDIVDKTVIDDFYNTYGIAWYYGIDEENERIFLPRKDLASITPKDTLNVYGDKNGLMFGNTDDSEAYYLSTSNSYNNSKPLYLSNNKTGTTKVGGAVSITTSTAHIGTAVAYGIATKKNVTKAGSTSAGLVSDTFKKDTNTFIYMVVGNTKEISAITDVTEVTTSENDTLPLFTPMYFDYKPNNVSWVKAGQQVNSGDIYTFVYNELVNELTTPKYGLKVIETADKVSGTDYSEYWEVNQNEMWFKTPTKISYKALNGGIKGNGKSLGITDGTNNCGITNISSAGLVRRTGAYNQDVGYSTTTNNASLDNVAIGVTTDPTKSGIIAEEATAQLYFKVANAVQNLELMDAGKVMETLADKVDLTDTQWAINSCALDYKNAISLMLTTTPYTAPIDGVIFVADNNTSTKNQLIIDGVSLGAVKLYLSIAMRVSKGSTIATVADIHAQFIPLKGAV